MNNGKYIKVLEETRLDPAEYEWFGSSCEYCHSPADSEKVDDCCAECEDSVCGCGVNLVAPGMDDCAQCVIAYYMNPDNNDEPLFGMSDLITNLNKTFNDIKL